jgi:ATP adenylyltransferase
MQTMFAPWRMQYILGEPGEGCVFCRAFAGQDDRETLVVHREAEAFVLMNRFPYNSGHVMVIPARHAGDPAELSPAEWAALGVLLRRTVAVVSQTLQAQGCNLGMNLGRVAGAGIADHLHFHVVPRWNGDTNYMPVLADTKIVSEALEQTWDKLRQAFQAGVGL